MNYYNTALQKIKCAQQTFSTGGCCCIGNIGPTGPTHTLKSESKEFV